MLLSPGKCGGTHAEKMNKKRENEKARTNTVEFKWRRFVLKSAKVGKIALTCLHVRYVSNPYIYLVH